jgi:ABC-2 type transport system ATP-binding protein
VSWGVDHVTVRFGRRVALDDVTLGSLTPGHVTGVVGGDGAGKTTLFRVLVGLLPVDRGEVRRPAPSRIGYLPGTTGTYPDLSVDENLAFAATAYGLSTAEVRRRMAPLLERTGLAPFRERLAGLLSGGMRQKLGVVRALLHQPELLVLDEPTTGIDPVSRADLWWLIGRAAAGGAAVVFATTYLDEAERATQLLVLDQGRALATGTPDEIMGATPGVVQARTGPPAEDEVARAWRRRGTWRVWVPDGQAAPTPARDSEVVQPDLQDAVTVLALQRELADGSDGSVRRETVS